MSSGEKTALWSLLFGLGIAVAALALPLAFDVPSYIWRIAFCLGIIISASSGAFVVYENFAKFHPSHNTRVVRAVIVLIFAFGIVFVSVLASIFIDEPRHFIVTPRVVITHAQPIFLSRDDGLRLNIDYTNLGPRAVRGIKVHYGIGFSIGGAFPRDRQDQAFVDLKKFPTDRDSSDFMETGANRNSTLPDDLNAHTDVTSDKLKEIQTTKGTLFIAIELSYFDDKTNDLWCTDFCEYWDYNVPQNLVENISPHLCVGHNGMVGPAGK